jgi:1-acyl-sn-glycerol-3-phosphate acyltransferase
MKSVGSQREPRSSLILYHLLKWSVVSPMLHAYFRGKIYGVEKVPQQGPLIITSNHASYFDPPLLSSCVGRPVAFMAKEELFAVPGLKQAIRLYGAYPVKRTSADRSALRAAIAALEQGWAVGIFLQGTRTADAKITEPKLGAATLAAKLQAPLLPVSLWGTEGILVKGSPFPRPVAVTVRIGTPLPPPPPRDREQLQAVTDKCAAMINEMHDLGR